MLWALRALALVVAAASNITKKRFWTAALVVPIASLTVYVLGAFGDAPYHWNGATIEQAAIWNLLMILPLVYLVLYVLILYETIVVYPDNQNFMD
ncbi:MAG: hypothetical protein GX483_03280 [Actinomycetaceae bacterium]|nr:hypothetical protein [Actinomycetaceae bacterium]